MIKFLTKDTYKLFATVIALLIVFFLTRYPFFYYYKVPLLGPDTTDYIDIMRMLSGNDVKEIGFPGVGYSLFLKFCFLFVDKLIFVVLIQTLYN